MSKCLKCGKELVCDQPVEVTLENGKVAKGFTSAPHGCPKEFNHTKVLMSEFGYSKEDVETIFDGVQRQQNGGTLTQ